MQDYGYGYWPYAVLSVVLFTSFLFMLPFRREVKGSRVSQGLYLSFIIALFSEMYGFPLTIYILGWLTGYQNPLTHDAGHLLFPDQGMISPLHFASIFTIAVGVWLVYTGWRSIYSSRDELVTTGVYARIRHPQYLGLYMIAGGLLLQWITIPAGLMFPLLIAAYYKLAKKEERQLEQTFGATYREYAGSVPMLLPRIHIPFRSTHPSCKSPPHV